MEQSFGLEFPLRFENGSLVPPTLTQSIDSSIKNLFAYSYKQRVFDRSFYTGLYDLLSEPADQVSFSTIRERINRAIIKHEKRVTIQNIDIQNQGGMVSVVINVKVNETQQDLSIEL